ncbi:MAG: hypothetical protein AAF696_23590 [Bacteroidota bacterium]
MKTNFFAHVATATSLLIFHVISSGFSLISIPQETMGAIQGENGNKGLALTEGLQSLHQVPGNMKADKPQIACWGEFSAKSEWRALYPDCSVSVTANDCNKSPQLQFSGGACYPSTGEIEIGTITVFQDLSPLFLYEVKAVYGTVVIVLIEEL